MRDNIRNGGSAFPYKKPVFQVSDEDSEPKVIGTTQMPGMTLRDYFAAKAMQGMILLTSYRGSAAEMAEGFYVMADAMLTQRKQQSEEVGMSEAPQAQIKKSKLLIVKTEDKARQLRLLMGAEWDVASIHTALIGRAYDLIVVSGEQYNSDLTHERYIEKMNHIKCRLRNKESKFIEIF